MNPTQLALTLAITGVASGLLLRLNSPREKAASLDEFNENFCQIEGTGILSVCTGAEPFDDDAVASDGQDGQEPFDPAPTTGGETPMSRLPIYG
jgi:hypothetical protein